MRYKKLPTIILLAFKSHFLYVVMSKISKKNIRKKSDKSVSSDEDSERELFYYASDRIKLMKEVLKLLKPKKIKSMAPECLKDVDMEEMNSMLLEELLGISKKRLKKIFEGQNNDDESSSESDEDIDIISLDDITDDDDIGIVDTINVNDKRHKRKKHRPKRIKTEKQPIDVKIEQTNTKKTDENEKLLSVLELLELQARARAIKSQLIIEAENKQKQPPRETETHESEDDAIIIHIPLQEQIIIASSESEQDDDKTPQLKPKPPKFRIIRNRVIKPSADLGGGLTITVADAIVRDEMSARDTVKAELLPEFIGPIEMIHLDTLDVDLNEIVVPRREVCGEKSSNNVVFCGENVAGCSNNRINDDMGETEDGEINDDKGESDNDDVLQLDAVIDD